MILREKKQEERSDTIHGTARTKTRRCFYDIVGKKKRLENRDLLFFSA
jgi:hypothetical protein